MLDDIQPSARLLAQMRALTTKQKLPEHIADRLACQPKMTAKKAQALAPGLAILNDRLDSIELEKDSIAYAYAEFFKQCPDPDKMSDDDVELAARMASANAEAFEDQKSPMSMPSMQALGYVKQAGGGYAPAGGSWDAGPQMHDKLAAGIVSMLDPKAVTPMGRDAAQGGMAGIFQAICRANGLRPWNDHQAVQMAHGTSDFPIILENAMTNLVARRMENRMPDIAKASHEVSRMDYRSGKSITLSATGMPQEVAEGGEIKFVTAEEKGEALPQVRDFASGFNISNQALTNDSTALGLLNDIGRRMVDGSIQRLRAVLLEPPLANAGLGQTMADGLPMFHADHGNVAASGSAITITSVSAARQAMRKQVGLNGELYAIEPWALVVPAELETAAQQIVAKINATTTSETNPFSNTLEVIVEPGLTNATAWYLIANPTRYDGLAHAFLDGQRTPRVETRQGWNTLGSEMRLVWALDAKFIETATWYRNAGA